MSWEPTLPVTETDTGYRIQLPFVGDAKWKVKSGTAKYQYESFNFGQGDGECSAAVAGKMLSNYYKINYVKAQWDEPIDLPTDWFGYKKLCILDFSLEEDLLNKMIEIFGMENIVWIDHHISKMDLYKKYQDIPGFRIDGMAACELTWKYFFDMTKMPIFIKWIGDRDLWKYNYGDNTRWFCEYMSYKYTVPESIIWKLLFEETNFKYYLNKGRVLRGARIFRLNQVVENIAYESKIDSIKCMKINYSDGESISDVAHIMLTEYDVDIAWVYFYKMVDGKIMEINSLRSTDNVDVSIIAKSRGGGGHKNASGWSTIILKYKN